MKIHLVSCVAGKLDQPAAAADLYQSDWFFKARAYAEAHASPWFILSAKHGLLAPNQVTAPYDDTLNGKPLHQRLAWGEMVAGQINDYCPTGCQIVMLAGRAYREAVTASPLFRNRLSNTSAPLQNMGIGLQKQWLAQNTPPLPPLDDLERDYSEAVKAWNAAMADFKRSRSNRRANLLHIADGRLVHTLRLLRTAQQHEEAQHWSAERAQLAQLAAENAAQRAAASPAFDF
jgi:hypothetical protein